MIQSEVALFEIKVGLYEREKQTKDNSEIWTKSDTVFEKLLLKDSLYFIVFNQYIDDLDEENWRNMLMNINIFPIITNILWINLPTTFISQNFSMKLYQCVPMA